MNTPTADLGYQRALEDFRAGGLSVPEAALRMSELISLLELATTVSSRLSGQEVLEAALLLVMGQLQCARGGVFVRQDDGSFRLQAARGMAGDGPVAWPEAFWLREEGGPAAEIADRLGVEVSCPVRKADRVIAVLAFGRRLGGRTFGPAEETFLRGVAACTAAPLENARAYEEVRRLNERLSLKVYRLQSLFELSRELTAASDAQDVLSVVTATLLGQLLAGRCVFLAVSGGTATLLGSRGLGSAQGLEGALPLGAAVGRDSCTVATLPAGPLRSGLAAARIGVLVPLWRADALEGLVALGDPAPGRRFSDEDLEFAGMLGRQALAALENLRLQKVRDEKQRQDRELQIARQIQQSLFPEACPRLPGFDLAAVVEPCEAVGGDYYDLIALPEGRWAVAVADVSGKGTPASILMASVHATLHALAGSLSPAAVLDRLNRFLLANTAASRYVTLVYGELDPGRKELRYVNAGHVPPVRLGAAGVVERLETGGPAPGLVEEAAYEVGCLRLQPGDVLALVTDGVTEALSPSEEELGGDGLVAVLRRARGRSAAETVAAVVEAVRSWTGPAGARDDLTAMAIRVGR
jgi:sigma-B regulation protein RsbU (phosphoserine phosphatase)